MKLKRSIVAGSLLAAAAVGVAFAVVLVQGDNGALGEQLARAVDNSETYFESEVSAYRYRTTSSETRNDLRDRRDLRRTGVDIEIRQEFTAELQLPDRRRISWATSRVYGDEPNKVYSDGPCPFVGISIGVQAYGQRCDGTWERVADRPEAAITNTTDAFAALRDLSTVTKQDSGVLRGVEVDVYAGTFNHNGQERNVTVKIGREHGLVRYFQATSPGFSWEIERWDFNSPDIAIEAPPLS